MPIYEFYCRACAHIEEILQKVNEPPPNVCPVCKKEGTFAKQVSQTSFQLKGGGWYSDLYASKKKDGETRNTTSHQSDATPSKTEDKPAAKPLKNEG